jgi:thermitase
MKNVEKKSIGKNNVILTAVIGIISVLLIIYFIVSNSTNEQQQQITATPSQAEKVTNLVPYPVKTGKVPGQLSIKFKAGLTEAQINQELQKYNAQIIRQIPAINRTIVQVLAGQESQVLQQLTQDSFIQNAEPSYYQHVLFVPNDTFFKNQWGLNNTGQVIMNNVGTPHDDINAEAAWDVSKGTGIKVAILDTGIDLSHPDIASKVVGQKIFVTSSIDDRFGHGTHVAGILAANTNNGQGVAGVCPDCQLLIGKAMDDNGLGDTSVISQAITWAADSGAKVINLSEGGDVLTQTQQDAVNYALSKGAVVVAAAGNNGSNQKFYPAAMSQVVSVGAVDNNDQLTSFSNFGTWVSVAAPGQDIYSTLPTKNYAMQNIETLKLNYDYLSGTSMAAPIVSGIAALVWASPYGTSNTAVIQRIETTVDKIAGTGTDWQYGRVNAAKAVGATATPTPTKPIPTPTHVLPTATPVPTQNILPTSTPIVPSYVCGGSTNSICPTPTPAPGENIQPTNTLNPTEIAILTSGEQPSSTNTLPSSTVPCTTTTTTTSSQSVTAIQEVAKKKHHKHKKRKKGEPKQTQDGLLKQFLDLLKQLIELINQLGNNTGTPTPCPTPMPTETPVPSSTISQQPTSTPVLSSIPTATPAPSSSISVAPTTASISQEPTATPAPSASLSETPIATLTPTPILSSNPSQTISVIPSTTPNNNNFATQIIKFLLDFINLIINFFTSLFR